MTLIMIILAVIGGATLSIQAAINGQLGSSVGVFKSAFLTFSVGALITAVIDERMHSRSKLQAAGFGESAAAPGTGK